MILVLPYRAKHLDLIDIDPHQAQFGRFLTPAVAASLEGPFAWTGVKNGAVLGCVGLQKKWLDHYVAWAVFSRRAGAHMLEVVRTVKGRLPFLPGGRIEAAAACDSPGDRKFLELLGFELEAARMRRYSPDGRDFALYALVKEPSQ
ncbi:MAG: hypothetical protein Q8P46_06985 [Hyphomicrobiales bacterium]|nr:hypothetical protein [Hyphomicrobiales bacterium]